MTVDYSRGEGRRCPVFSWAGGHHIGVSGEHQVRALASADRPQVTNITAVNPFDVETQGRKARGENVLAAVIRRRYRLSRDELACQLIDL